MKKLIILLLVFCLHTTQSSAQADAIAMLPTLAGQLSALGAMVETATTQLSFVKIAAEKLVTINKVITGISVVSQGVNSAKEIYEVCGLVRQILLNEKIDAEEALRIMSLVIYISARTIDLSKTLLSYIQIKLFSMNDYERMASIQRDISVLESLSYQALSLYNSVVGSVNYYKARTAI